MFNTFINEYIQDQWYQSIKHSFKQLNTVPGFKIAKFICVLFYFYLSFTYEEKP